MRLLLVEDDPAMQTTLQRTLKRRGFEVSPCTDGAHALAQWAELAPDIVVLDLSLPGLDGLDVLTQARKSGLRTPVLILTARGTVGDKVLGLNAGADDYLPKPFDLDELEARLKALYRRHAPAEDAPLGNKNTIKKTFSASQTGGFSYENESGAIYYEDEVLDLPPRELALLQALLQKPGKAVSKERLFDLVFPGEADVHYEAIEVVVYRLRKRLQTTRAELVTLRGLGYLLKFRA